MVLGIGNYKELAESARRSLLYFTKLSNHEMCEMRVNETTVLVVIVGFKNVNSQIIDLIRQDFFTRLRQVVVLHVLADHSRALDKYGFTLVRDVPCT